MTFHEDIIARAKENTFFRQVLCTGEHAQVVVMCLQPGEDIGSEVHTLDQIIVIVEGEGNSVLNDVTKPIKANDLIYVPAGTKHNFTNTSADPMKLYTVYAPAEHRDGTIHRTKAEAQADEADHPE
jgi:mannose-6-phosphate isomerase-like protein (cupin superfamily)